MKRLQESVTDRLGTIRNRQSRDRMRERKVYQIHEYYNRRVEKIREGHIPDH